MRLLNKNKNIVLAEKVKIATGFWMRAKGLIGENKLEDSFALVIPNCNAIHTFFMANAIDAVFFDAENKILKAVSGLAPWRLSFGPHRTSGVIELPAGRLSATNTEAGDVLLIPG